MLPPNTESDISLKRGTVAFIQTVFFHESSNMQVYILV